MQNKKSFLLIPLILFVIQFIEVNAQTFSMRQKTGTSLTGGFNLPIFKNEGSNKYTGWTVNLNLKLQTSEKLFLLAEIPFASGGYEHKSIYYSINKTGTTLGNPFVGLQFLTNTQGLSYEAGIRIPLTSETSSYASYNTLFNDLERWYNFAPNTLMLTFLLNYEIPVESGMYLGLNIGPDVWIWTKKMGNDDFEIIAKYFGALGYKNEFVNVFAGIAGAMIVTEEKLDFDERSYHQLVLNADLNFDGINPGIVLRVPFDKFIQQQVIIGFNLGIRL